MTHEINPGDLHAMHNEPGYSTLGHWCRVKQIYVNYCMVPTCPYCFQCKARCYLPKPSDAQKIDSGLYNIRRIA